MLRAFDPKTKQFKKVKIDKRFYPLLSRHVWRLTSHGYVYTAMAGTRVYLHHLILGHKAGFVIDHVDFSKLNNTLVNLRHLTNNQNLCHSRRSLNKWKGIRKMYHGKWQARISTPQKEIHVGVFKTKAAAFKARSKRLREVAFENSVN